MRTQHMQHDVIKIVRPKPPMAPTSSESTFTSFNETTKEYVELFGKNSNLNSQTYI